MLTAAVGAFKRDCSHSTSCTLLGTVKQISQKMMTSIFFFLSMSPFLQGENRAPQFQQLVSVGVPGCVAAPGSYSHSRAGKTMALEFSFTFWCRNTGSQPCKLLHTPTTRGGQETSPFGDNRSLLADKRWGPEGM